MSPELLNIVRAVKNPAIAVFLHAGATHGKWFAMSVPASSKMSPGIQWQDLGLSTPKSIDAFIGKLKGIAGAVDFRFSSDGETDEPTLLFLVNRDVVESLSPVESAPVRRSSSLLTPKATRFDEFWAVYPRRDNKKKAMQIWAANGLDNIADQIIADVESRVGVTWTSVKYIPMPTTYLNGERWNDESPSEAGDTGLLLAKSLGDITAKPKKDAFDSVDDSLGIRTLPVLNISDLRKKDRADDDTQSVDDMGMRIL